METPATPAPPRELALVGGQTLVVREERGACTVRLVGADGGVTLAIEITPEGPILRLGGGNVRLQVEGDLALAARRLALHADEGLELSSGGDLHVRAAGVAHSRAQVQTVEATTGNVHINANDHVKLKGELIKLNC